MRVRMAREIKVFMSDNWVSADYIGSDEESYDLARLLYTMIIDFNALTRIGHSGKRRKGKYHIEELYEIVKNNFSGLCNDKCLEAKGYKNMPKWKHVVRCAIRTLKEKRVIMKTRSCIDGEWYFKGK